MTSLSEGADPGVWPAYVAAIAGLLQTLLLTAAVLAIMIYQLGQLAGKSVPWDKVVSNGAQSQILNQGRHSRSPHKATLQAGSRRWTADPSVEPASKEGRPGVTRNIGQRETGLAGTLVPEFAVVLTGQGVKVGAPDALVALTNRIKAMLDTGKIYWHIRLVTATDDSHVRRMGYLRIVMMRDVLLLSGVDASHISIEYRDNHEADVQAAMQAQTVELAFSGDNLWPSRNPALVQP